MSVKKLNTCFLFIFQVVEVNGINVEGKTPNDVLMILKMAENTITFKLIPNETKVSPRESREGEPPLLG